MTMTTTRVSLGVPDRLLRLFSHPNTPGSTELLRDTILHWVEQMLARDGFAAQGADAAIRLDGSEYVLEIVGPPETAEYGERLPRFLEHGQDALAVVDELMKPTSKPGAPWPGWVQPPAADRIWDPQGTGKWRFFLPFGMAMLRQRSLQFFHYPPIRLLDTMRDYLDDPVPVRLIELLEANGVVTQEEAWLYSTVMDGAPVAAPDDQGTIYPPPGTSGDAVHLIPIQRFHDYQRAQVELLLNTSEVSDDHTVPMVVYGTPARITFGDLYLGGEKVSSTRARTIDSVVPGKQTPVLGSGHPYAFYAQVQAEVGAGSILPEKWPSAVDTMIRDLVVCRWQVEMARDPTQDAESVRKACDEHWTAPEQARTVAALILHQGSLYYPDPSSLEFTFNVTLDEAERRIGALHS